MQKNKLVLLLLGVFLLLPAGAHALEVEEVIGNSGVAAWLVEEHSVPLVTVKVAFRDSGYASDEKGKQGRAALASDLLEEGAGTLDAQAFHAALEERAIDLDTGLDEDMVTIGMRMLSEHTDKAFDLLGLALTQPQFSDEAIARIRARAITTLAQLEQQPGYIAGTEWAHVAFGTHPYGQRKLGTKESIAALTRNDFTDYATHYLTRKNIIIAVVGDITPEQLKPLLDSTFGALPDNFAPPHEMSVVTAPAGAKTVVVQHDVPQSVVIFGVPGVMRNDPDFFPAYVMNYLLGGDGLTSRLGIELRDKRGLAYSAGSGLDLMLHSATLKGNFATRNEATKEAIDVMEKTLADIREHGFGEEELKNGKQYLTGAFPLQLDSNAEIAGYLITMQLFDLGKDYIDKRNAKINAVTLEQVNAVAKKLLDPSHLLTVVAGNPVGMK